MRSAGKMLAQVIGPSTYACGMNANGYPFMTRRQILARIEADPAFAVECVTIVQERHERRGVGTGESMGWMASHAAKATKLGAKLASGEATDKERVEAAQLVKSYAKQLARVFRDRELAARPDLAAQAAVFGVGTGNTPTPPSAGASPTAPPRDTSEQTAAALTEQVLGPRKRGRPKGSKNKPKADQPARRRRPRA